MGQAAHPKQGLDHKASVYLWFAGLGLFFVFAVMPVRFAPLYITVVEGITLDALLHFLSFCILSYFIPHIFPGFRSTLITALGLIFFGFFMEAVQIYIPKHSFSLVDFLADALGLISGLAAGCLVRYYFYGGPLTPTETDET